MSAVLAPRNSEQELFNSQMLPRERGISQALFFRQLQAVTTRTHATEHGDGSMLKASATSGGRLFNAERATLYAASENRTAIDSRIKTGLNTTRAASSVSTHSRRCSSD